MWKMNTIVQPPTKLYKQDNLSIYNLVIGEKCYFIRENNISSEGQIVTRYNHLGFL